MARDEQSAADDAAQVLGAIREDAASARERIVEAGDECAAIADAADGILWTVEALGSVDYSVRRGIAAIASLSDAIVKAAERASTACLRAEYVLEDI